MVYQIVYGAVCKLSKRDTWSLSKFIMDPGSGSLSVYMYINVTKGDGKHNLPISQPHNGCILCGKRHSEWVTND